MWNRQSPAWALIRTVKLISAGTAVTGAVLSVLLLAYGGAGVVTTAVCYGVTAVGLMVTAVILWRRDIWRLGKSLSRRSGLLSADEYCLRGERLTTLEVKRSPLLSVFNAVRVMVYTSADSGKDAEKSALLIKREEGRRLAGRLMTMDKGYVRKYSARHRDVLLFALSQANFFSGLLLTIPLISWTARHIDQRLSGRLYSALETTGKMILPEISPVLSALALVPVVGWALHLLYVLFSYGNFRFVRSGGSMMVGRGVIRRRTVCFPTGAVTALEMRKTLLTGLGGRESCRVIIPGYSECVLIPSAERRDMSIETAAVFPHGEPGMSIDTAKVFYWWRWWAAGGVAVLVLTARAALAAEMWRDVLLLCGVPAAFVLFWRAAAGAAAGVNASVRMFTDSVEITGVRAMSICRLRVLRGDVAEARVTQNIFQQTTGLCSMYIRPQGAKRGLRCCHLPIERCLSLLGRLG